MSVTTKLMAAGSWGLRLRGLPRRVRDGLDYFEHVAVLPARVAGPLDDTLLDAARYVGVIRGRKAASEELLELSGAGLAIWLGDEDGKGDVLETAVSLSSSTFADAIRALLPGGGSVAEGTLYAVAGTYTGDHRWQDPRTAIDYVCDVFGAEWRVGTSSALGAYLDAGAEADLFVTTPKAVIARRVAGPDGEVRGLPAVDLESERDAEDYTTRVVLLAEGEGETIATGSADAASVPYKDLNGNLVKRTRLVSESETASANAAARAQLALNRFSGDRKSIRLSTDEYDVEGVVAPGDTVHVYDPDAGLVDEANELRFRGEVIHPVALRVRGMTWPVAEGMGVYHRDKDGVWTDLTDHVEWEQGATTVEVGANARSLTGGSDSTVGIRTGTGDSSVPAQVTGLSLSGTNYQDAEGATKARITATWTQPLNTDGSTVVDGQHYDVRWRASGTTDWQVTSVGFDTTTAVLADLATGVTHEVQVRAVDAANPPNSGAWSATESLAITDSTAPSTPAAPTVAGNPLNLQVSHTLGQAAGGTYNLEEDLSHLEVHVSTAGAAFTPDDTTHVGDLNATRAMLIAAVPAIGTFEFADTTTRYVKVIAVDRSGNKSAASASASASATLIDTAHITDLAVTNAKIASLAVDKITAGSLTADVVLATGALKASGAGGSLIADDAGLRLYPTTDWTGTPSVDLKTLDGTGTFTGTITGSTIVGSSIATAASGPRIEMFNGADADKINFYDFNGAIAATVGSFDDFLSIMYFDSNVGGTGMAFVATNGGGVPDVSFDFISKTDFDSALRIAHNATDIALFHPSFITLSKNVTLANGTVLSLPGHQSTSTKIIDFGSANWDLYQDNTGSGGSAGRLWFDAPHGGEIVLGPRAGANNLNRLRVRGNIQVENEIQTQDGSNSAPSHNFTNDGDTGMFRSAANDLSFSAGGGTRNMTLDASGSPGFRPGSDNTTFCGHSSFRWHTVYSVNGIATSSDERGKERIERSDLGLAFLLDVGGSKWRRPGGERPHYGVVAQRVKAALDRHGADFAGYQDPSYAADEMDAECPFEPGRKWGDEPGAEAECAAWHAEQQKLREAPLSLLHHELWGPTITALEEINNRLTALENA